MEEFVDLNDEVEVELRNVGKAAGPDGWHPSKLDLLPPTFFEALAEIWSELLEGQPVPEAWRAIRCVGIPKESALTRPLARPIVTDFYRFFRLSWETSPQTDLTPGASKRSGSGRIESSSKSTTFLM